MAILAIVPSAAIAGDTAEDHECFDAVISARIIRQIPSDIPDCDNCIIMRWPWFVDLKIERLLKGQVPRRQFSVLALLHTDLITSRPLTWSLRRNADGGFNAQPFVDEQASLCAETTAPASPYIRPEAGQTLDDLRKAGIRKYGQYP